jgi:hypothetical protein
MPFTEARRDTGLHVSPTLLAPVVNPAIAASSKEGVIEL